MLDTVSTDKRLHTEAVPQIFRDWFDAQGWSLRDYQEDMVDAFAKARDTLLIAPTGGGKTLAGLLPSLIDLHQKAAFQRQFAEGVGGLIVRKPHRRSPIARIS